MFDGLGTKGRPIIQHSIVHDNQSMKNAYIPFSWFFFSRFLIKWKYENPANAARTGNSSGKRSIILTTLVDYYCSSSDKTITVSAGSVTYSSSGLDTRVFSYVWHLLNYVE